MSLFAFPHHPFPTRSAGSGSYSGVSRRFLAAIAVLALAGCALEPDPITPEEHFQRAREDQSVLESSYLPVKGPLTVEEAIARALKYNYDAQLAKTEVTLQERQLDLALSQMLPRIAANAGYSWRNNDNAAQSVSERTKIQSLEPSFSEEPEHHTADIQFSWNLLDVGVSYFQAKQQGYRAFVAVERRRKVLDSIVKDVEAAYWKAMAADKLIPPIEDALARAERVVEASHQAHQDELQPPLVALDFQQSMLQVIGQLRRMRNELRAARMQLATLINAPPTTALATEPVDDPMQLPKVALDRTRLEALSLAMRPELREEAYQEKISRQDIYKEMIKMMPAIGILGSLNYDSNKYLTNNTWGELGVRATVNLVGIIQGPQAIKMARASVDVAHARRLALSVAVLTQVNMGFQNYLNSLDNLEAAGRIQKVQQQIATASNNASIAQAQSDAERVRRTLTAMVTEMERYRAIVDLHTTLANLYTAVGIDIVPPTADFSDLDVLTAQVKRSIVDWEAGRLPEIDVPAVSSMPNDARTVAVSETPSSEEPPSTAVQAPGGIINRPQI